MTTTTTVINFLSALGKSALAQAPSVDRRWVTIPLTAGLTYLLVKQLYTLDSWLTIHKRDDEAEQWGAAVVEEAMRDSTEEEDNHQDDMWEGENKADVKVVLTSVPTDAQLLRYAKKIARTVKEKLGPTPTTSEANRLVAWELLQKVMKENDVRRNLRVRFAQLALPLVFLPDRTDILMRKVCRSEAVSTHLKTHDAAPARSLMEWAFGQPRVALGWRKT